MPSQEPAGDHGDDGVPSEPMLAVADLIARHRPRSRRLRRLIALLTGEPMSMASLIRRSALPRQTVEEVLSCLGDDLSRGEDGCRIRAARVPGYRQRFGFDQLLRTEPADPLGPL